MAWTAPASPRLLSDIRMTSALFKHMSNRDFPGGPRRLSEKGQSDERWSTAGLQRPHAVVLRVVLDLGQMQGLQDRRDVHTEPAPQSLLQAVPPGNRVLWRSSPGFNGPIRRGLLFVCASQRHPVAVRLQHLVQVVDAPEVVSELRAARLHDERRRIQCLVTERLKLGCAARCLQLPWMFARTRVRFRCQIRSLDCIRLRRTASRRLQTTRPMSVEGPLDLYFNDSPPSGDGAHGEIQVLGRSFASPRVSERWAPWARISFTATSESPGFTSTPRIASRSTRIVSPRRTPSSAVARTQ